MARALATLRHSLVPDNTMHTTSTPPPLLPVTPKTPTLPITAAEVEKSKRAAAVALLNALPRSIALFLFPSQHASDIAAGADETAAEAKVRRVERENAAILDTVTSTVLAPFEDAYLNRHVVYAMLECIVVAVMPELGRGEEGKSVRELLRERGVGGEEDAGEKGGGVGLGVR